MHKVKAKAVVVQKDNSNLSITEFPSYSKQKAGVSSNEPSSHKRPQTSINLGARKSFGPVLLHRGNSLEEHFDYQDPQVTNSQPPKKPAPRPSQDPSQQRPLSQDDSTPRHPSPKSIHPTIPPGRKVSIPWMDNIPDTPPEKRAKWGGTRDRDSEIVEIRKVIDGHQRRLKEKKNNVSLVEQKNRRGGSSGERNSDKRIGSTNDDKNSSKYGKKDKVDKVWDSFANEEIYGTPKPELNQINSNSHNLLSTQPPTSTQKYNSLRIPHTSPADFSFADPKHPQTTYQSSHPNNPKNQDLESTLQTLHRTEFKSGRLVENPAPYGYKDKPLTSEEIRAMDSLPRHIVHDINHYHSSLSQRVKAKNLKSTVRPSSACEGVAKHRHSRSMQNDTELRRIEEESRDCMAAARGTKYNQNLNLSTTNAYDPKFSHNTKSLFLAKRLVKATKQSAQQPKQSESLHAHVKAPLDTGINFTLDQLNDVELSGVLTPRRRKLQELNDLEKECIELQFNITNAYNRMNVIMKSMAAEAEKYSGKGYSVKARQLQANNAKKGKPGLPIEARPVSQDSRQQSKPKKCDNKGKVKDDSLSVIKIVIRKVAKQAVDTSLPPELLQEEISLKGRITHLKQGIDIFRDKISKYSSLDSDIDYLQRENNEKRRLLERLEEREIWGIGDEERVSVGGLRGYGTVGLDEKR